MHGVILAIGLAILIFSPPGAEARQTSSFEQLRLLVKAGDAVTVTDSSGQISRDRISQLSASSLTLIVDRVPRDMPEAAVAEIQQRRADSLGNGFRNGAIAGAAFGVLGALIGDCGRTGSCAAGRVAVFGFFTGIGAGMGGGMDALFLQRQVIYRARNRPASTRLNIAPLLQNGRKGISLSVSF